MGREYKDWQAEDLLLLVLVILIILLLVSAQ